MTNRTTQLRQYLEKGELKQALRIFKTFRKSLDAEERRTVEIAYESLTGKEAFYRSLGINTAIEIITAKHLAMQYLSNH